MLCIKDHVIYRICLGKSSHDPTGFLRILQRILQDPLQDPIGSCQDPKNLCRILYDPAQEHARIP